jgi:hypothetical protein
MMSTLKEFLKDRAEIERGRANEKLAIQQEWKAAVERLINQIFAWLKEADELQVLKIEEEWHHLREVSVGVYNVPGLVIRLEAQEVRVVPIARDVVGPVGDAGTVRRRSLGRVDLKNAGNKYMLFRTERDPDQWVIVDDVGYLVREWNRQTFDEAIQSLLQ